MNIRYIGHFKSSSLQKRIFLRLKLQRKLLDNQRLLPLEEEDLCDTSLLKDILESEEYLSSIHQFSSFQIL